MEWCREKVICLIALFEERPCLWDRSHKLYRDRDAKNVAMLEISEQLGLSCIEVERKINTLLTQYRREKHVQKRMESVGCTIKKPWFGYNLLKFLDNAEKKCVGKWTVNRSEHLIYTNPDAIQRTLLNPENINVVYQKLKEDEIMPGVTDNINTEQSTETSSRSRKERSRRHSPKTKANEAFRIMKTAYRQMQNRDDLSIFAEGVEHRLRKLKNKKKLCILKHQIETLLFTAEMEEFTERSSPSSPVASTSDGRPFSYISGTTSRPDDSISP